jgi:hypothetical protein
MLSLSDFESDSEDGLPAMLMHYAPRLGAPGMQRMSVAGATRGGGNCRAATVAIVRCCGIALGVAALLLAGVLAAHSLGHGPAMRHMTVSTLRGVLRHVEGAEARAADRAFSRDNGVSLKGDLTALAELVVAEAEADRGRAAVSAGMATSPGDAQLKKMDSALQRAKAGAENGVLKLLEKIEGDVAVSRRGVRSEADGEGAPVDAAMAAVVKAANALADLDDAADANAEVAEAAALAAASPEATATERREAAKTLDAANARNADVEQAKRAAVEEVTRVALAAAGA